MTQYLDLVVDLMEIVIIPLLGVLTTYLVKFLNAKANEISSNTDSEIAKKYIEMITNTITDCVIATNQTYVEALKKEGKFDEEAQKIAFEKTLNAVLDILGEDAKLYIKETFGDLEKYLTQLIESTVNQVKE